MNRSIIRPVLPAALALALLTVVLVAPAAADETVCTGTLGSGTHDDIRVPDGAACTLDGTRAEGNVVVGTGARLTADGARIDGNVQAEGAADVRVSDSEVGGSVQLEQGGSASVTGNAIDSDFQFESNSGALVADRNTVGGNIQVNQNTGGADITRNVVDGNLQCQANQPAPTGGGNTVHGSAEDQCANLTGGSGGGGSGGSQRATGRLAGPTRFETAVEITRRAYPNGADVLYIARGNDYPDALAGGNLTDGPVLLVPSCSAIPDAVLAEIRRLDPERVIALGGSAAICDTVLQSAADA